MHHHFHTSSEEQCGRERIDNSSTEVSIPPKDMTVFPRVRNMMINNSNQKKKKDIQKQTYLCVECKKITGIQMTVECVNMETLGIKHKNKVIKEDIVI